MENFANASYVVDGARVYPSVPQSKKNNQHVTNVNAFKKRISDQPILGFGTCCTSTSLRFGDCFGSSSLAFCGAVHVMRSSTDSYPHACLSPLTGSTQRSRYKAIEQQVGLIRAQQQQLFLDQFVMHPDADRDFYDQNPLNTHTTSATDKNGQEAASSSGEHPGAEVGGNSQEDLLDHPHFHALDGKVRSFSVEFSFRARYLMFLSRLLGFSVVSHHYSSFLLHRSSHGFVMLPHTQCSRV